MSKSTNIALLVNSQSGKNKAVLIAQSVEQFLFHKQIQANTFIDTWPSELHSFSDIWLFGGDGTLNYFVNHYPDCTVPLSIFPAGTGNDFAFILYGKMNPLQQADYILNAPVRKVDAGKCNGMLFMNGVGLGFDGEVLKAMKQIRKIGGGLGYLLAVVKQVFFFKEISFSTHGDLTCNNQELLLFMINNSSRTGGGFHVSPLSTVDDGFLDVVISKPLSILKRLLHLSKIKTGKHLNLPFIKHHQIKNITVNTNRKCFGQLDGELIEGDRFEFAVLKDRFLFRY